MLSAMGMLWSVWLVALLFYSAWGAVRLRAVTGPRYTRFIYSCVLGVAVLPLLSNDWVWSLVWLIPGIIYGRLVIRRHDVEVHRRSSVPPAV